MRAGHNHFCGKAGRKLAELRPFLSKAQPRGFLGLRVAVELRMLGPLEELDCPSTSDLEDFGLTAGTYEVTCSIPGHAAAGMKATLVVGGSGSSGGSSDMAMGSGSSEPDYAAMDKAMTEGAAAYRDEATARQAFNTLSTAVHRCAEGFMGASLVGDVGADAESLRTRPGRCGRDYRLKSSVLVEVTFCTFPESVPEIVMTNILNKIPGG